jgi:hypothetical protein
MNKERIRAPRAAFQADKFHPNLRSDFDQLQLIIKGAKACRILTWEPKNAS